MHQKITDELKEKGHAVASSVAVLAWPVLVVIDQSSGFAYGAGQPGAKTCAAITKP